VITQCSHTKEGRVNFKEFYFWYTFSKKHGDTHIVKLQSKYLKQVKKWHTKSHKKFGSLLEQKFDSGKNEFSIQINVGQFEKAKYEIGAELRAGLEHKQFAPTLLKHFSPIDEHNVQIVYTVNTKNPELVKEKLEEFINNSLELAAAMIPDEKQPIVLNPHEFKFLMIKEALKFEYVTTENQVLLRVYGQNEFIDHAVQEGGKLVALFQTEEFSFLSKVKLGTFLHCNRQRDKVRFR
jgi:hypothetical protein